MDADVLDSNPCAGIEQPGFEVPEYFFSMQAPRLHNNPSLARIREFRGEPLVFMSVVGRDPVYALS